eukprot:jgi/Astpho2/696/e_gw1.00013.94.1_t
MAGSAVTLLSPADVRCLQTSSAVLANAPGTQPASAFVCVGDTVDTDQQDGYLRGHGTQVVDGKLQATVCGVVQRVNKLVSVIPLRSRYGPELGDVVIGRVTEASTVANKRWKVSLGAKQDAALQLSAVNLPGGVQRRRNTEDELNMRAVYQEGDLISAEIQSFYADGSIALHTRSTKYGKLAEGILVEIPTKLIKRQKQHFVNLDGLGIGLILGLNGSIWVSTQQHQTTTIPSGAAAAHEGLALQQQKQATVLTKEERSRVVRVAACIRALAKLYLLVYPATILETFQLSVEHTVDLASILQPVFLQLMTDNEAKRRQKAYAMS